MKLLIIYLFYLQVQYEEVVHEDNKDSDKDVDETDPIFGMDFKTGKELKKAVKKKATKEVKKSKIFQMQHKIEQRKQRKKSSKQKEKRFKARLKHNKVKGQVKQ